MADAATIVGPRKTKEQLQREHEIYLKQREKEGVLRRLQRKGPGVVWEDTYAMVPVPGPVVKEGNRMVPSTITYKVWLPGDWQENPAELTVDSIIKLTKQTPVAVKDWVPPPKLSLRAVAESKDVFQ
jgi:hypothetical protein